MPSYDEALSMFHISQETAEIIIFLGILVIGVGYVFSNHFREIVLGVFALCILAVIVHHKKDMVEDVDAKEIPAPQTDQKMFMEDCMSLTGKKDMCDELWKERQDRKSTRLNSSHIPLSRMPSSA